MEPAVRMLILNYSAMVERGRFHPEWLAFLAELASHIHVYVYEPRLHPDMVMKELREHGAKERYLFKVQFLDKIVMEGPDFLDEFLREKQVSPLETLVVGNSGFEAMMAEEYNYPKVGLKGLMYLHLSYAQPIPNSPCFHKVGTPDDVLQRTGFRLSRWLDDRGR